MSETIGDTQDRKTYLREEEEYFALQKGGLGSLKVRAKRIVRTLTKGKKNKQR